MSGSTTDTAVPRSPDSSAYGVPPRRLTTNHGTAPKSADGRQLTILELLKAFSRRWIPALAFAVPAALVLALLVWELIPAQYESYALLKINQYDQKLSFDTKEQAAEFDTYRQSQINMIESRGVLAAALRASGVAETTTIRQASYPVEFLQEELDTDMDISPEFIRISLAGRHAEDLPVIINAVKDAYLNHAIYGEQNERLSQLKLLEENYEEVNARVRANQNRIDQLAEDLGTGNSEVATVNQRIIQREITMLQQDLAELTAKIRQEEATKRYLTDRGLPADQGLADNLFNPIGGGQKDNPEQKQANTAQGELMMVRRQIRQFERTSRVKDHPDLLALKEREAELVLMLGATDDPNAPAGLGGMSRLEVLHDQRRSIQEQISTKSEELATIQKRLIELEREKEDISHDQKVRDQMASQIAERRVEISKPPRISVIQEAFVPEERQVKKKVQLSLLAAFATFGAIICGFTFFEWFSYRVGTVSDLTDEAQLRVLGTIPSPDRGGLLGLGILSSKVDPADWNRAVTESTDVIRTYLMRHIDPSRPASLLVTSASANEGKTTISCQLAASLARTGARVALVDCDFRRPSAHLMIGARPGPGLCEYIRGTASLDEISQSTQAAGLTFISAGQVDQAFLQRLSSDGGRSIIKQLKEHFDFVILDTSPLLFVAEPSMLAQNADIVLLATRKDYSRVPYVLRAHESLRNLRVPLLGSVMVGSDSDFQRQTYGYQQEVVRIGS